MVNAEYFREYKIKYPEKIRAAQQRWADKNKDAERVRKREYMRQQREENPERVASWAANCPPKPEQKRAWDIANPARRSAIARGYKARKLNAMPSWLSTEHKMQIDTVYHEASRLTKLTGIQFHVDHIVPLKGKTVRGLHVPWNLQAIPYYENLEKGARV